MYWIDPNSPSHGAGTPMRRTYGELFPDSTARRVIFTQDVLDGKKLVHRTLTHVVDDLAPDLPEPPPRYSHAIALAILAAMGDYRGPVDIFTDGSWGTYGGYLESVFFPKKAIIRAGASLVIIRRHPDWRTLPIISLALTNGEEHEPGSAYPMELLALSVAIRLTEMNHIDAHYYSDCQGAIKAIRNPHKLRYWANKANLLLLRASSGKAKHISHVRSHPEKVWKDKETWTRHMMGNHLADRSSIQDYSSLRLLTEYTATTSLSFRVSEALELFTQDEWWYWVGKDGMPTLKSFMDTALSQSCDIYTAARDSYRELDGRPPNWSGRSYSHAALCAELKYRTPGDKARLIRILWDLVHHGGNQRKYDPSVRGTCNLCLHQDSARHWMIECKAKGCRKIMRELSELMEEHLAKLDRNNPLVLLFAHGLTDLARSLLTHMCTMSC